MIGEPAADGRRTARLLVAYDGTDFHGFAESAGVPTVAGSLRRELERVVRCPAELTGAGRTDAGVHAWGQVVSTELPADVDLGRVAHALNRLCGPSISVRDASWAAPGFSARFSATARTYRYQVWNSGPPNPLLARFSWHVPMPLDIDAMNRAATSILGTHDFSSFCRRPRSTPVTTAASLVRRVDVARWTREQFPSGTEGFVNEESRDGSLVEFEISASAFCHQMVRSIVGTLVDVGLGRRGSGSVEHALQAKDRSVAGRVAPPTGLVLWHVDYRGQRWDARPASATGDDR